MSIYKGLLTNTYRNNHDILSGKFTKENNFYSVGRDSEIAKSIVSACFHFYVFCFATDRLYHISLLRPEISTQFHAASLSDCFFLHPRDILSYCFYTEIDIPRQSETRAGHCTVEIYEDSV